MKSLGFASVFPVGLLMVCALIGPSVFGQQLVIEKSPCGVGDPDQIRRTPRAEAGVDDFGNTGYKIRANESWRHTDVAVKRGQRIEIAASGIVKWAPDAAAWTTVNADGTRPPYRGGWNYNHFPFPESGIGSLVMRIGKGIYPAGSSVVIEAEDDGQVEFMINDDVLSDNSGSFHVRVHVRQD